MVYRTDRVIQTGCVRLCGLCEWVGVYEAGSDGRGLGWLSLHPLADLPLLGLVGWAAILGRALLWLWVLHLCGIRKLGTLP